MATQRDLIHTEKKDGFSIAFYACQEFLTPSDALLDDETCRQIDAGQLSWFMAEVTASRDGIELGTDYLGGCCWASPEEFITTPGYYANMVENAIAEANKAIARLHPAAAESLRACELLDWAYRDAEETGSVSWEALNDAWALARTAIAKAPAA